MFTESLLKFVNNVNPEARADSGFVDSGVQTIWGTTFKEKKIKRFLLQMRPMNFQRHML